MSFSKNVKEELSRHIPAARHCQIAELAAIISLCGQIVSQKENYWIGIHTENITVARKFFTLLIKAFNIYGEVGIKKNVQVGYCTYIVVIREKKASLRLLKAIKFLDEWEEIKEEFSIVNNLVVQNFCCKRAFLRGAFLASGSISNPEKSYHYEIVSPSEAKAIQLRDIIQTFEIDAKIVIRKRNYVVYVKEGSQIVNLLNIMGAHIALMKLENLRIVKEMRNSINRQVNCETANISKTVEAAEKQMEDILLICDNKEFGELSESLKETAYLRMEYPEASLKELGALLHPPIGKSGVNHRLKKLSMIAEQLREQKEEKKYDVQEN